MPLKASGSYLPMALMPYFGCPPRWTLNFPRLDCAPMPRFLIAPPMTPSAWPLKCVSTIIASAAAIACAMYASFSRKPSGMSTR